jgi:hypothetical protein
MLEEGDCLRRHYRSNTSYWTLDRVPRWSSSASVLAYLRQFQDRSDGHRLSRDVVLGLLHRPVHLPGRRGRLGGHGRAAVLPPQLQGLRQDDHPRRVPGHRRRHHVHAVHLRRHGQPIRIMNVILHPTPNSMMFWDTIVLNGYLVLNILISHTLSLRPSATCRRRSGSSRSSTVHPLGGLHPHRDGVPVLRSAGAPLLADRHPGAAIPGLGLRRRARAADPAGLILRKIRRSIRARRRSRSSPSSSPTPWSLNVFFVLMEVFTAVYSDIPEHVSHFKFLYTGTGGREHPGAVDVDLGGARGHRPVILLINPKYRRNEQTLAIGCGAVFISLWIDKGLGMVIAGFVPSPLHPLCADGAGDHDHAGHLRHRRRCGDGPVPHRAGRARPRGGVTKAEVRCPLITFALGASSGGVFLKRKWP